MAKKKMALGRGLGALISTPENTVHPPGTTPEGPLSKEGQVTLEAGERVQDLRIEQIVASPFQPRKRFPEEAIEELKESIREHGVIQPLIVREVDGKFELIAGERRMRACEKLGLQQVPAIVRTVDDRSVLEMALIENIQREDLNPIEEAEAYVRLAREFNLTQEDISQRVGRSRAAVANAMRLLGLDPAVQLLVSQGSISTGHAKAILGINSLDEQRVVADMVVRKKLTVRDTEKAVQQQNSGSNSGETHTKSVSTSGSKSSVEKVPPYLLALQDQLRSRFASNVAITHGEKKGRIEIEYYGNEDLERILELLGVQVD